MKATNRLTFSLPYTGPMYKPRLGIFAASLVLTPLLLMGCGSSAQTPTHGLLAQAAGTETPASTPAAEASPTPDTSRPNPTVEILADCLWVRGAEAFVDVNGNKRWDRGEPPLSRVRFHVDDTLNHFTDVAGEAVSDAHGMTQLYVGLPGCPAVEFEVYAEVPAGYILTTPARISHVAAEIHEEPVAFGFQAVRTTIPLPTRRAVPGMPNTGHPAFPHSGTP